MLDDGWMPPGAEVLFHEETVDSLIYRYRGQYWKWNRIEGERYCFIWPDDLPSIIREVLGPEVLGPENQRRGRIIEWEYSISTAETVGCSVDPTYKNNETARADSYHLVPLRVSESLRLLEGYSSKVFMIFLARYLPELAQNHLSPASLTYKALLASLNWTCSAMVRQRGRESPGRSGVNEAAKYVWLTFLMNFFTTPTIEQLLDEVRQNGPRFRWKVNEVRQGRAKRRFPFEAYGLATGEVLLSNFDGMNFLMRSGYRYFIINSVNDEARRILYPLDLQGIVKALQYPETMRTILLRKRLSSAFKHQLGITNECAFLPLGLVEEHPYMLDDEDHDNMLVMSRIYGVQLELVLSYEDDKLFRSKDTYFVGYGGCAYVDRVDHPKDVVSIIRALESPSTLQRTVLTLYVPDNLVPAGWTNQGYTERAKTRYGSDKCDVFLESTVRPQYLLRVYRRKPGHFALWTAGEDSAHFIEDPVGLYNILPLINTPELLTTSSRPFHLSVTKD